MDENEIAKIAVNACFKIHNELGPGLLESVENIKPVHKKQLLTYLRLANIKLGLLINFNEALIKNGITRIANNL